MMAFSAFVAPASAAGDDAVVGYTADPDPIDETSILTVTSTKGLSNVVYQYCDGSFGKQEFSGPEVTEWEVAAWDATHGFVSAIWVKSGNNKTDSNDPPSPANGNGNGAFVDVANPGCGDIPFDCPGDTEWVDENNNQIEEEGECIPDQCPNVDGFQTTVPDGLVQNNDGDCVEDVCPNVDGLQETVPTGLHLDNAGNCVGDNSDDDDDDDDGEGSRSVTVNDVCDNIDGVQTSLPTGMLFSGGNCVPEPDLCPNVDGTQDAVPEGLEVDDDGNCVELDVCPNLDGAQAAVPENLSTDEAGNCVEGEVLGVVLAAPEAPAELPRTGVSSAMLALAGAMLVLAGGALTAVTGRRRIDTVLD